MNRTKTFPILHAMLAVFLIVILAACSEVKEGKVVGKGIDRVGTKMHPGPIHWIDIRGKNREERIVTARVEFFEMDWKGIKKGDWVAPAQFGFPRFFQRISAYNAEQRAESGRFSTSGSVAKPKAKGRGKSRPVAKPAAETAAPEGAAPSSEGDREAKLRQVRERAIEDEGVRALKKNIHAAASDEEQTRAWQEYRKALHEKMRALDPSLSDLIDKAETAPPGGR